MADKKQPEVTEQPAVNENRLRGAEYAFNLWRLIVHELRDPHGILTRHLPLLLAEP